ncbi:MAG: type II secretion system F family protein [Candidatus ainarchaeum sp.]|nr:type II secretion system F family protein [Candidatus ainarchaeum sp.]
MNKIQNPTLMLFPLTSAKKLKPNFLFIGKNISKLIFSLSFDLKKAEMDIDSERYSMACLFSALIWGIMGILIYSLFGILIFKSINSTFLIFAIFSFFLTFFLMFFFHLFFPRIRANKIAKLIEQDLLFALRTMLIQVSSGVSLFSAIREISISDYGQVSKEFENVVLDVNTGINEFEALEKLAFKTKSDILKKTIWQILTTMRSGGSVVHALESEISSLNAKQFESIKNYSAELNLWTLMYLIVAAAIPSLGVTFLVIASAVGSATVGKELILGIVVMTLLIQIVIIFLIRSRVPKVIK